MAVTKSKISERPKRPPTPAQRLAALDEDLAEIMDEWKIDLDRDYDLAFNANPAPPIVDAEEALAYELGHLDLALDPFLEVADRIAATRDEAYMVLGRVEQLIAQRTLDAVALTPRAALAPPPDDDDDPTLRNIHEVHTAELVEREELYAAGLLDDEEGPSPTLAVRVGGWWRRTWAPIATILFAVTAATALLLRGVG